MDRYASKVFTFNDIGLLQVKVYYVMRNYIKVDNVYL